MNKIKEIHRAAMHFANIALDARRLGNEGAFKDYSLQAYQLEKQAAEMVDSTVQPTHAVLHRSAATIALDCGKLAKALELVEKGLNANPPAEIAEELLALRVTIEGETKNKKQAKKD